MVILDLNMPGMGGRQGLNRMLAIKPDLKTIVTSGYSSAAIVDDIHKKGTAVYVEKPYQLKELSKIIRQILDNHS